MCGPKMIVPWKCHVCREKVAEKEGGLCVRCERVACVKHLRLVLPDDISGENEKLVCVDCLSGQEKIGSIRWWKLKQGLLERDE